MISVVITAYNVAEFIEKSIQSVLNQTLKDIECVVVLDKPTDNTEEIVEALAQTDERIVVVKNETNVGAGLSRRYGVANSSGDYILLLDGDDWLDEDFLEKLYTRAVEMDADITSGGVRLLESNGYYETQCCGDCVTEGYEKITKYWGLKTVFMNNRLIKRYLFDTVPYSSRRYIEDTPTIIPMLWYANKVVYVDTCGYNYRVNPNSLTHTSTPFKEFLFKGLCWCDLVEFFNEKDKELYKYLDLREYVKTIIEYLNKNIIGVNDVNQFGNEWAEFCLRFFNLISIYGIDYKVK